MSFASSSASSPACLLRLPMLLLALLLLASPPPSLADAVPLQPEDSTLAAIFARHHARGTLVIASLDSATRWVHDDARSRRPFLPASTFKIPNTLIALDEKAMPAGDTFRWDGKERAFPAWNRDQTLESAFRSSCVWCYQELARKVGLPKYRKHLAAARYGNALAGPNVETFWLSGDLRITAREQIDFLGRLVRGELPFSRASLARTRDVMVLERTPAYVLRAKTGWAQAAVPELGWFVGYVEIQDKTWLFALNMDIASPEDLPLRQAIVVEALKAKGILPR